VTITLTGTTNHRILLPMTAGDRSWLDNTEGVTALPGHRDYVTSWRSEAEVVLAATGYASPAESRSARLIPSRAGPPDRSSRWPCSRKFSKRVQQEAGEIV